MIRAIAAIDDKRGLATDTGIPWDIPTDRAYLRKMTTGGNLLMGYGTYKEFASAPPDRHWFVVIPSAIPLHSGFQAVPDLDAFMANPPQDLWLYGGAGVFVQTIDAADELYLTRIQGDYHCTKFFPEFENTFHLSSQTEPQTENGYVFHFEVWKHNKRAET